MQAGWLDENALDITPNERRSLPNKLGREAAASMGQCPPKRGGAAFSRSAPSRFGVTRGQFSKKFPILAATTYRVSQTARTAPSRWKAKAPLRTCLKGAASHERQRACYATQPRTGLRPAE